MGRRKAFGWQETKIRNCGVTPQANWPSAKSLMKLDEPKASAATHHPFVLIHHQTEKASPIVDCLEN
jgi:hypothetical protein